MSKDVAPLDRWFHSVSTCPLEGDVYLHGGLTTEVQVHHQKQEDISDHEDPVSRSFTSSAPSHFHYRSAGQLDGVVNGKPLGMADQSGVRSMIVLSDLWVLSARQDTWERLDVSFEITAVVHPINDDTQKRFAPSQQLSPLRSRGISRHSPVCLQRYSHTLTALEDGRLVLVGGADGAHDLQDTVWVADTSTRPVRFVRQHVDTGGVEQRKEKRASAHLPPMIMRRKGHCAASAHHGKLLIVMGGEGANSKPKPDCIIFSTVVGKQCPSTGHNSPWPVVFYNDSLLLTPLSLFSVTPLVATADFIECWEAGMRDVAEESRRGRVSDGADVCIEHGKSPARKHVRFFAPFLRAWHGDPRRLRPLPSPDSPDVISPTTFPVVRSFGDESTAACVEGSVAIFAVTGCPAVYSDSYPLGRDTLAHGVNTGEDRNQLPTQNTGKRERYMPVSILTVLVRRHPRGGVLEDWEVDVVSQLVPAKHLETTGGPCARHAHSVIALKPQNSSEMEWRQLWVTRASEGGRCGSERENSRVEERREGRLRGLLEGKRPVTTNSYEKGSEAGSDERERRYSLTEDSSENFENDSDNGNDNEGNLLVAAESMATESLHNLDLLEKIWVCLFMGTNTTERHVSGATTAMTVVAPEENTEKTSVSDLIDLAVARSGLTLLVNGGRRSRLLVEKKTSGAVPKTTIPASGLAYRLLPAILSDWWSFNFDSRLWALVSDGVQSLEIQAVGARSASRKGVGHSVSDGLVPSSTSPFPFSYVYRNRSLAEDTPSPSAVRRCGHTMITVELPREAFRRMCERAHRFVSRTMGEQTTHESTSSAFAEEGNGTERTQITASFYPIGRILSVGGIDPSITQQQQQQQLLLYNANVAAITSFSISNSRQLTLSDFSRSLLDLEAVIHHFGGFSGGDTINENESGDTAGKGGGQEGFSMYVATVDTLESGDKRFSSGDRLGVGSYRFGLVIERDFKSGHLHTPHTNFQFQQSTYRNVATVSPVVATVSPVVATVSPVVATVSPVVATVSPVVATRLGDDSGGTGSVDAFKWRQVGGGSVALATRGNPPHLDGDTTMGCGDNSITQEKSLLLAVPCGDRVPWVRDVSDSVHTLRKAAVLAPTTGSARICTGRNEVEEAAVRTFSAYVSTGNISHSQSATRRTVGGSSSGLRTLRIARPTRGGPGQTHREK